MELLVLLRFRSSQTKGLIYDTNFGIGSTSHGRPSRRPVAARGTSQAFGVRRRMGRRGDGLSVALDRGRPGKVESVRAHGSQRLLPDPGHAPVARRQGEL